MQTQNLITKNKNIFYIALGTLGALAVPLVAMQFTKEVNWSLFDFTIAGIFIFGAGLAYELISRKLITTRQRIILAAVLALAIFYIWAELAVGIFFNLGS